MRLRRISLEAFRNISFAEFNFEGMRQFFVGANAQGKTNLIEAVGFVGALRSFRQADARVLIQEGKKESRLVCDFVHERFGDTNLAITMKGGGKEVWCDGEKMSKLADYLGRFLTVVLSSQDQLLIRGAPGGRRRWLDLTLAASDAEYLRRIQEYYRALAGRNILLKQRAGVAEIISFERPLAEAAHEITLKRRQGVENIGIELERIYAGMVGEDGEQARTALLSDEKSGSVEDWLHVFERHRERDLKFGATLSGPHRDDLAFTLGKKLARDYGSEGQQRSLAISLRLAEAAYLEKQAGAAPVLLVDDVLGELDESRRMRFWNLVGEKRQVMATGTSLPEGGGNWEIFRVEQGSFDKTSLDDLPREKKA